MPYLLELSPAAQRQSRRVPRGDARRIRNALRGLVDDPRPIGSVKLRGFDNVWRIREGDYRIIYEIHDNEQRLMVLKVARRNERTTDPMTTRPPDRPRMTPSYGVGDPQYGFEPIEWSWVVERMTEARSYWIVTTRADGRPHVMPVWGVWVNDAFHFVTDARNLSRPATSTAIREPPSTSKAATRSSYWRAGSSRSLCQRQEDGWRLMSASTKCPSENVSEGHVTGSVPAKALAWTESDFPKTATRWRFERGLLDHLRRPHDHRRRPVLRYAER